MRGFGDRIRSCDEVRHLFNDTFPNRPPISKSTVGRTIQRFEQTGKIADLPRSGRPKTANNEDKALDVLQCFVENPHESIVSIAQQQGISRYSVSNILKTNSYKGYKTKLVQELSEDDFDRRIEFCEVMMNKINENLGFLANIVFTDESTFCLNGTVNRHNCRYWSDTNPHWMIQKHTQHPEKLNVWAGIVGRHVVGPFFVEGNLNSEVYLALLQNQIIPEIQRVSGDNFENIWLQHDGAPPHYGVHVRHFLDNVFPHKWIGRRGRIEWPARSPDLSPLDYFFWGYLKEKVYKTKPQNLDELRNRIVREAQGVPVQALNNAISAFYNRLGYCQQTEGKHFEHLL